MSDNIPQVVPGDTHPSWEWLRSVSLVLKSNLLNPPTLLFLYWYEKTMCFVSMFTYSSTFSLHSYSLYIRICVFIYILLFSCGVVSHSFCDPMDCSLARILCLWGSSGKNTGVSCHFLLQEIFLTQGLNPHLLHWQVGFLPLSHLESPIYIYTHTYIHTHTHIYVYYIYNINVVFLEYESQKKYLKWKKLRPNRWTHSIYKFTLYITENRLRLDILRVTVLKLPNCDFPQARVAFTLIQSVIFCPQAKLVGRLLLWNSCEAGRRWLIYINASFNQEEGVRGQVGGVWVTNF